MSQLLFYERASDIDDLILNTTGAFIGALIYFSAVALIKRSKKNTVKVWCKIANHYIRPVVDMTQALEGVWEGLGYQQLISGGLDKNQEFFTWHVIIPIDRQPLDRKIIS